MSIIGLEGRPKLIETVRLVGITQLVTPSQKLDTCHSCGELFTVCVSCAESLPEAGYWSQLW